MTYLKREHLIRLRARVRDTEEDRGVKGEFDVLEDLKKAYVVQVQSYEAVVQAGKRW